MQRGLRQLTFPRVQGRLHRRSSVQTSFQKMRNYLSSQAMGLKFKGPEIWKSSMHSGQVQYSNHKPLATLQTNSPVSCLMDEVTKIQARRGTHEIHTQVRSVHNGSQVSRPQEKKACHDCLEKVIPSGSTERLHAWKLDLELKKTCLHSRPTSTPAWWVLSSDLFLSLSFLICQMGTIIVLMFVMRELIHDKHLVRCPVYAACLGIRNWSLQF